MRADTKTGLTVGIIGALATSILMVLSITRSTSSTAAIGFIFIPVYFAMFFAAFFVWGYSIGTIRMWRESTARRIDLKIGLAFLVAVGISVLLVGGLARGLLLTSITAKIQQVNTERELSEILENSLFKRNRFVLGGIAQNPAASAELLGSIARLDDPNLHEKMGSLFPLLGDNGKGLAVMRLVLRHRNVSPNTVEYLASSSQVDYVLGDVAGNPKAWIETLRSLEKRQNYLIDWGLARNPRTPDDVFLKLLEREKYFTQRTTLKTLLRNPSISAEVRAKASELLEEYSFSSRSLEASPGRLSRIARAATSAG